MPLPEPEGEDIVQEMVETALWPTDDLQELIERLSKILPKNDTGKYSTTIRKINWDDVTFKNYGANDCKYQWTLIQSKLRHYRTLTELVLDARDYAVNPYHNNITHKKTRHPEMPKKPLTPFFRYFAEKREKYKKKHPEASVTDTAKGLAEKYAALPEKRKAKYKRIYDEEMAKYREQVKIFKLQHPEVELLANAHKNGMEPSKPKTPFQIFYEEKTKKMAENTSRKENFEFLRKAWGELSDSKRIKWIKKSLDDVERFNMQVKEFRNSHPDFEPPVVKVLNKAEKELKEKMDGKPDRPPASGYSLFSKIKSKDFSHVPAKDRVSLIAKHWAELSQEEKDKFNKQAWEDLIKYNELLEIYLKTVSCEDREKIIAEERRCNVPSMEKLKKNLVKLKG